jgi:hypothetical protein
VRVLTERRVVNVAEGRRVAMMSYTGSVRLDPVVSVVMVPEPLPRALLFEGEAYHRDESRCWLTDLDSDALPCYVLRHPRL